MNRLVVEIKLPFPSKLHLSHSFMDSVWTAGQQHELSKHKFVIIPKKSPVFLCKSRQDGCFQKDRFGHMSVTLRDGNQAEGWHFAWRRTHLWRTGATWPSVRGGGGGGGGGPVKEKSLREDLSSPGSPEHPKPHCCAPRRRFRAASWRWTRAQSYSPPPWLKLITAPEPHRRPAVTDGARGAGHGGHRGLTAGLANSSAAQRRRAEQAGDGF